MSGILKITNTIIRCVSSWLRCKCFEDTPSEQVILTFSQEEISRKTDNTNSDTENSEVEKRGNVNMHELPKYMIIPLNKDLINTPLGNCCQQFKAEEVYYNRNKAPIKPFKKSQIEVNKHIPTGNLSSNTSSANHHNKEIPTIIVTFAQSNDCLLTSNEPENISRSLTSSIRNLHQRQQTSSSYLNLPVPSRRLRNIHNGHLNEATDNIKSKKDILTSTKIDSKSDTKKSWFTFRPIIRKIFTPSKKSGGIEQHKCKLKKKTVK